MTSASRFVPLGLLSLVALWWGGCGGSTTATPSDAGPAAWSLCTGPGECTPLVPGCCGGCGAPTLADVTGVNVDHVAEFRDATCSVPNPTCPRCPSQLEPNLVAFCESGACEAQDVRESELSACTRDAECVLRDAACCAACTSDPFQLIALAASQVTAYTDRICKPRTACPACAPILPEGWVARCSAQGHCEVAQRTNVCPETQPSAGEPCTLEAGLVCEYGDEVRPGCRARATCGATWSLAVPDCAPLPGPGQSGCPASVGLATGSCASDGLLCDMGGDALCVCASCLGPCSQFPVWACSAPPTTPGCPSRAPLLGSACSSEGLVCTYGMLCHPTASAGRRCVDGAWKDEPLACPA